MEDFIEQAKRKLEIKKQADVDKIERGLLRLDTTKSLPSLILELSKIYGNTYRYKEDLNELLTSNLKLAFFKEAEAYHEENYLCYYKNGITVKIPTIVENKVIVEAFSDDLKPKIPIYFKEKEVELPKFYKAYKDKVIKRKDLKKVYKHTLASINNANLNRKNSLFFRIKNVEEALKFIEKYNTEVEEHNKKVNEEISRLEEVERKISEEIVNSLHGFLEMFSEESWEISVSIFNGIN